METLLREQARRESERRRVEVGQNADAIRLRCRSLYGFIKEAWAIVEPGSKFVGGWAIETLCDHLEAVTRGEIKRLLINIPPGTSKSTTVSVFWAAWEWGPQGMAHLRYLATSYSGPNAIRDTTKMRTLVESEWYQRLWGDTVKPTEKWGERLIVNSARGFREGRPFSKMTGGRGDRVIIDDPHDTENAESLVQRSKTVRIFRESISDRLNDPAESAIVVIMQRLHSSDVAGEILRLKLPYVHLNLPMEFEPTRKEAGRVVDATCRTYVNGDLFFQDPRTEDGELLFPERFSSETVADLKHVKGSYAWAGQYQQRPTPREGGMFKREWFEGDGTPETSRILDRVPPFMAVVRYYDLAGTEKRATNDPDYTVGTKMGRTKDGRFVIEHVDRYQLSPGQTETRVRGTAMFDGQKTPIGIPEDPGAAGKYMVRALVKALVGFVVRAFRPSGSKETRATPLAIQAEHGNVWLVKGPWNQAWLDEVCTFPNGRFDDQVDSASDAFNFLAPVVSDARTASAGDRKTGVLVEESRESELMRQARNSSGSGRAVSAPGRRMGILD